MAELVFFAGTMDCGKSTLAMQMDYTHARRGRRGLIYTQHDRAGDAKISSRLGLSRAAIEVGPGTDFWADVTQRRMRGWVVDYLVCDEAQFYSATQVDHLARLVDELDIDVFTFGIMTDFRTRMFAGSARLVELADRVETLQVQALCWCGRRATHNARTVGGRMVIDGEQVVVADTGSSAQVAYEVLCRRHHVRRLTAAAARAVTPSPDTLSLDGFGVDAKTRGLPGVDGD
ncbi:thymidine kinase [Pseudactinotalea sp. Z1732]|uniref:thymidine kinase n=1 Tax=Micrococcales TaxID=85006 RepID=UPI003C7AA01B